MKVSSTFSPDEVLMRITLSVEFLLITEKNMPSFLGCPRLIFSVSQISCLSCWMQSKGRTRLAAGKSLQDGCRAFARKLFFQTQQQGHEQAEEPLPTYVVVRLKPSSDPM
ncbi:hypothetical protein TNCV_3206161 [Trichonephila clavipes]|nr:hypothetical protein TNCV_3206161 [Trichonephila clavipes]